MIPSPTSVVLVTALPNKISPPSSPPIAFTVILSPVTINEPVISVFEFIETFVPVSVIFESFKWSPPADFATLPLVKDNSEPNDPELLGPDNNIPPPYPASLEF